MTAIEFIEDKVKSMELERKKLLDGLKILKGKKCSYPATFKRIDYLESTTAIYENLLTELKNND